MGAGNFVTILLQLCVQPHMFEPSMQGFDPIGRLIEVLLMYLLINSTGTLL